jgi:hypothetical protein
MYVDCWDQKNALLEMVALCTWLWIPLLAGPLLRVNCLIHPSLHPTAINPPPFPFFLPIQYYYSHRQHNMPESSCFLCVNIVFNVSGKFNAGCFRLMDEKECLAIMRGSKSGIVGVPDHDGGRRK